MMKKDKGFWGGVADTVIFQPNKSGNLQLWKDGYRLNRELKEMERYLHHPPRKVPGAWWRKLLQWMWMQLKEAWYEFYDTLRATLMEALVFLMILAVTIAYYAILICLLFWIVKVWLE